MMRPAAIPPEIKRRIAKDAARGDKQRDAGFRRAIRSIPKGKVSTYGKIAASAGYPLYHRAVARLLRTEIPGALPWHRVVGAGGEIKLRFEAAAEQRLRLETEGVKFRGKRVDMEKYEHTLRSWETLADQPDSERLPEKPIRTAPYHPTPNRGAGPLFPGRRRNR